MLSARTPGVRARPPHGRVKVIFYGEGYGFLESEDGRDIYFHENSVLDSEFERLEVGHEVAYSEEMGDKGPQASSLRLLGKQGHVFPQHR